MLELLLMDNSGIAHSLVLDLELRLLQSMRVLGASRILRALLPHHQAEIRVLDRLTPAKVCMPIWLFPGRRLCVR